MKWSCCRLNHCWITVFNLLSICCQSVAKLQLKGNSKPSSSIELAISTVKISKLNKLQKKTVQVRRMEVAVVVMVLVILLLMVTDWPCLRNLSRQEMKLQNTCWESHQHVLMIQLQRLFLRLLELSMNVAELEKFCAALLIWSSRIPNLIWKKNV